MAGRLDREESRPGKAGALRRVGTREFKFQVSVATGRHSRIIQVGKLWVRIRLGGGPLPMSRLVDGCRVGEDLGWRIKV